MPTFADLFGRIYKITPSTSKAELAKVLQYVGQNLAAGELGAMAGGSMLQTIAKLLLGEPMGDK
jgi:hypothetical protein